MGIGRKLSGSELSRPSIDEFREMPKLPVVVILDNVRSLHNVGSVFRTADAFAVQSIELCGITATPPNREIQKTALGATESVLWNYWDSTLDAVHHFKSLGYEILAVEQVIDSVSLQDIKVTGRKPLVMVFGHEVSGVHDEVLKACDSFIEIPQQGTKHSLNVAVSVGVVLWEISKKMSLQ